MEKKSGGMKKKRKELFLTAPISVIMSIRNHSNALKVPKKTVRTAIKQDLSPDLSEAS